MPQPTDEIWHGCGMLRDCVRNYPTLYGSLWGFPHAKRHPGAESESRLPASAKQLNALRLNRNRLDGFQTCQSDSHGFAAFFSKQPPRRLCKK